MEVQSVIINTESTVFNKLNSLTKAGEEITSRNSDELAPHKEYREIISSIEDEMRNVPGAMFGDCCPLKHSFAKGLYIREFTGSAGLLVVSKLHKQSSASFLLKGEISIWGTDGYQRIKAPASWVSPAGTKRIVYFHTDTILTGVYATEETDIEKIEESVIAKDFNELDNSLDAEFVIKSIQEATKTEEIEANNESI
jgi:hypothetical protein